VTLVPAVFATAVIVIVLSMLFVYEPVEAFLLRRSERSSGRAARWWQRIAALPRSIHEGLVAAIAMVKRRDRSLLGAIASWGFDIAVLWAAFRAFGHSPPGAVLVMGYYVGALANVLPFPGGVEDAASGRRQDEQKRPQYFAEQPAVPEPRVLELLPRPELERESMLSSLLLAGAEGYRLAIVHRHAAAGGVSLNAVSSSARSSRLRVRRVTSAPPSSNAPSISPTVPASAFRTTPECGAGTSTAGSTAAKGNQRKIQPRA
jgi:hypothetical protein